MPTPRPLPARRPRARRGAGRALLPAGLALSLGLPLALAAGGSAQDPEDEPLTVGSVLPDGPAAEVWARVGPETDPAELPDELLALLSGDPWSSPELWRAWASWVRAEAEGPSDGGPLGGSAERRAALCLVARAQGRPLDAWTHFAALGGRSDLAARVGPVLFPGVPLDAAVERGGRPAPLPADAVLTPIVPPRNPETPPWVLDWREATHGALRVGDSEVDLWLSIEGGGVQLDLDHRAGPAVRLGARLPEPVNFHLRVEYIDFERQEGTGQALSVTCAPEDEEEHVLYARVLERELELPRPVPGHVPAQLREEGLAVEVPADDPDRPWLTEAAGQVAALVGVPVHVVGPGERPGALRTVLPPVGERAARLAFLVSAVEAHVLRPEVEGAADDVGADAAGESGGADGGAPAGGR